MLMRHSPCIPAAAALLCLLPHAARTAELPRKAPEYIIRLSGGQTLPLSQYKGHVVILAFIETFCPHCQATVGVLTRLQNEYRPRGLQVLATAIDKEAPKALPLFVKNFSPSFPVGYNDRASAGDFFHPTGALPLMPLMAILDGQGIIRIQHQGEEPYFDDLEANLRKEIEPLLRSLTPVRKSTKKTGVQ